MLNKDNAKDLINGLLEAPPTEIREEAKAMIASAKTKDDWEHTKKVCEEFSLCTHFALAIISTITEEWEE